MISENGDSVWLMSDLNVMARFFSLFLLSNGLVDSVLECWSLCRTLAGSFNSLICNRLGFSQRYTILTLTRSVLNPSSPLDVLYYLHNQTHCSNYVYLHVQLGRICLDILKDKWSPALQIRTVLLRYMS